MFLPYLIAKLITYQNFLPNLPTHQFSIKTTSFAYSIPKIICILKKPNFHVETLYKGCNKITCCPEEATLSTAKHVDTISPQ